MKHGKRLSRKFFVVSGVVALTLAGGTTFAVAQVTNTAKVNAYGFCVNKTNGNVRALERTNLQKSVWGKCKSNETKVLVKEGTWLPTPVAVPLKSFVINYDTDKRATCTLKPVTSETPKDAAPEYDCK